jgi:hypothetical protein
LPIEGFSDTLCIMPRWIKSLRDTLTAIAALGLLALAWLLLTQVIAAALAVVVGFLVTLASDWLAGLLAGIIAYAAVMKLAWYLEIFDMIGWSPKKKRKTDGADESGSTSK